MRKYLFLLLIIGSPQLESNDANDSKKIKKLFLSPFKKWEYTQIGGNLIADLTNLLNLCGPCGKELEKQYQKNYQGSVLNFPFEVSNMKIVDINSWAISFWELLFKHGIDVNTLLANKKTLKEMTIRALEYLSRTDNWYTDKFSKCSKLLKIIIQYEVKQQPNPEISALSKK